MTKKEAIKKVTFPLRNPFEELEEIFYVINSMILEGAKHDISVKWNTKIPYLILKIHRCRNSFASIEIMRDLLINPCDKMLVDLYTFLKQDNIPFFKVSSDYNFITIYFVTRDIALNMQKESNCTFPKLEPSISDVKPYLELKFTLRKPFSELLLLKNAINRMIKNSFRCLVELPYMQTEENKLLSFFIYEDNINRPSLTIKAILKSGANSIDKNLLSKWNFLNSISYFPLKDFNAFEVPDNRIEVHFTCYPKDSDEQSEIQRQIDCIFL